MADGTQTLTGILDDLDAAGRRTDRVSVDEAAERVGHRGFGPFLLLPALLEMSPVGAIPGVPTLLAGVIVMVSIQIAAGRSHLWLPGIVERRTMSAASLRRAVAAVRPVARRFDRWFHARMPALTGRPANRFAALACIGLCLTVPPLEFLPFASTAPMAAIAAFGFAMLVRDGLVMACGFVMTLGAFALGLGLIGEA